MRKSLIFLLTNVFKGIIYSGIFGIIGLLASFILKWPFLKGAYYFVMVPGVISLGISVILFIGTPKDRFEFFTKLQYDSKIPKKVEVEKDLGEDAWIPGIIGSVMVVIAFIIEAMMH